MNDCGDSSDENPVSCTSYQERCNFEVNTCNWYQDQDDDFDWTRTQGVVMLNAARPGTDNTKGTRGFADCTTKYVYRIVRRYLDVYPTAHFPRH